MMWRLYAGIALSLALAAGGWYLHHKGYEAGVASQQAAIHKAQADAQKYIEQRDALADKIARDTQEQLHDALPKAKADTKKAAERVRIIYKDHPVDSTCRRPDGVHKELEAARDRANAAARGLHGSGS